MKIRIDAAVNFSLNYIDEEIFDYILKSHESDGIFELEVADQSSDRVVELITEDATIRGCHITNDISGDIITCKLHEPIVQELNECPAPEAQAETLEEQVITDGPLEAPPEDIPPDQEPPILAAMPVEDDSYDEDDFSFRDVQDSGSKIEKFNENLNTVNINDAPEVIAEGMNSDLASRAKVLKEQVNVFSKKMSILIELKNKIDVLRTPIENHPFIKKIIEQAKELIEDDSNKIDDVLFTKRYLIIRTKDLQTVNAIDGNNRLIGRIEFRVLLKTLFGEANTSNPIIIRNLTREYLVNNSDGGFQCPHVCLSGTPCYGSAWECVFESFVNVDLFMLTDILTRFVTTPNLGDEWGRNAKNWPIVGGED